MEVEVTGNAFAIASVKMDPGDVLFAAPGSMATMRGPVDVNVSLGGGGVMRAMFRRYADQTSIMSKFTAKGRAIVGLAPEHPGAVVPLNLSETGPLRIEAGSLLAYEKTVNVTTRLTNVSKWMMNNSAVGLHVEGSGFVLVSAFGALQTHRLRSGESMIVDSGHMVAWSDDMHMKFGALGGVAKANLVREGLVGQFEGPGTILTQTRQRDRGKTPK